MHGIAESLHGQSEAALIVAATVDINSLRKYVKGDVSCLQRGFMWA